MCPNAYGAGGAVWLPSVGEGGMASGVVPLLAGCMGGSVPGRLPVRQLWRIPRRNRHYWYFHAGGTKLLSCPLLAAGAALAP